MLHNEKQHRIQHFTSLIAAKLLEIQNFEKNKEAEAKRLFEEEQEKIKRETPRDAKQKAKDKVEASKIKKAPLESGEKKELTVEDLEEEVKSLRNQLEEAE